MSLSSKFQEKHGYSKTVTEYKSEKIQEEKALIKAKKSEVLIDKDGNKFFTKYERPICFSLPETSTVIKRGNRNNNGNGFRDN